MPLKAALFSTTVSKIWGKQHFVDGSIHVFN